MNEVFIIQSAVPVGREKLRKKYLGNNVKLEKVDGRIHRGELMMDSDSLRLFVRDSGDSGLEFIGDFLLESGDNIDLPTPRWPDSSRTYNVSF